MTTVLAEVASFRCNNSIGVGGFMVAIQRKELKKSEYFERPFGSPCVIKCSYSHKVGWPDNSDKRFRMKERKYTPDIRKFKNKDIC